MRDCEIGPIICVNKIRKKEEIEYRKKTSSIPAAFRPLWYNQDACDRHSCHALGISNRSRSQPSDQRRRELKTFII